MEEYIKGGGSFETEDIYNIILSICDIINCLHNLNPPIIYGKLMPSNIIITSGKKAVLIDSGVAETDYTMQTDIYEIGTIMYFMVSGRLPLTVFEPLMDESYGGNLDMGIKRIIKKCFEIDMKKRYVSVEELNKEIVISLLNYSKLKKSTDSSNLSSDSDKIMSNIKVKRRNRHQWKRNAAAFFARIF